MKAFFYGVVCLLCAGMAYSQANSQPELKPRGNAVQDLENQQDNSVPPDAPVVTINGACDKTGADAADCKTIITRAQFEKLIRAVQPNMPKPQQRAFAARYVNVLLLADKAHQLGLDKGPEFDEQMYIMRLQVAARLAGEEMQKDAGKISDSDIEAYYKDHTSDFRTISYDRLYIPKQKSVDASATKPNDPDAQKKREESEADMKAEADKLRARAAAGEDFTKLQKEAYDFAGLKLKAPETARVDKVNKRALPQTDAAIFDLKKGDVSQVFNDPQGFLIYKVVDFQDQPLADVHEQVARTLQSEKIKSESDALKKTAEGATYDSSYFAAPVAPSLRNPGEAPPAPQQTPSNGAPAAQPKGNIR